MSDVLTSALREMRASGNYDALLQAIPYARMLGLTAAIEGGVLVTHLAPQDRLIGNPVLPALHGGTVGALMESAAHRWVLGVQWHPERPEPETAGFAQTSRKLWEAFARAVSGRNTEV